MLHSGHVAFFEEAASYGDLYVGLGSDATVADLKGRPPVNSEEERRYMVSSLKFVKEVFINSGSGLLDFEPELRSLRPDMLLVNEDGHSIEKERLCAELGIGYRISRRVPKGNLPVRSTTNLRRECHIPYRIDLAGGWLDQPFVSKFHPGPVITISIEPDYEFNDRSGMATSTRKKAIELWQTRLPAGDREKLAQLLFSYENPPGTHYISGSQDALGIVMPGVNRLWYPEGGYWPSEIQTLRDDGVLSWLEHRLWLVPIRPREVEFDVLRKTSVTADNARELAEAAEAVWQAIQNRDEAALGGAMIRSFRAQVAMFPLMVNDLVQEAVAGAAGTCLGYKLSGAGGGGYLVLVSGEPRPGRLGVRIRRSGN